MIAALLTKTILRIRALVFYAGCVIALLLYFGVVFLAVPFLESEKRQYLLTRYNIFVLWWGKLVCGVNYKIEGLENIPAGPCIVLSNHQSSWETFMLQTLFSPLSTVLKQELLKIPLFGWGLRMLYPIALDRSQPAKAYKQLISQGRERVSSNRSVLIFPEGTRVTAGDKVKFNRGGAALAHQTQVPIVPIAHNAGLRWPSTNAIPNPGTITVRIGKPIYTAGKSKGELYESSTHWIESNRDALLM